MSGLFLPLLFIFVPVLILLYMATEIHSRDRGSRLHRWTAILLATYALMQFGLFLINVLPDDLAPAAAQYIAASSWFLNILAGFHFLRAFIQFRIPPILIRIGSLASTAGFAGVLARLPGFEVTVQAEPVWRSFERGQAVVVLVSVLSAYSFFLQVSCYWLAYRKLKEKPWAIQERQRVKLYLLSITAMMVIISLVQSFKEQLEFSPYVSSDLVSMLVFMLYAGGLRYSMIKYDFLSWAAKRYEILFNRSPVGISLFNKQGVLMDANPAYLRMIGVADRNDRSWQRKAIGHYVVFDNKGEAVPPFVHGFEGLQPQHLETSLTNRLNESYVVEMSCDYFELDGQLVSFVLTKDITVQKESEEKLAFLAHHDPLTGLANRRRFHERLETALRRADPREIEVAVILIDLDQFKWINDTLGHQTGDELLRLAAERLEEAVPEDGCLARLGGDEFCLLLPVLYSEYEAEALARDMINSLRLPFTLSGQSYRISASVGISVAPRDGIDVKSLLRNADTAMYCAKKEGRDRYRKFVPQQGAVAEQTLALVNGLRTALEYNEFTLLYQPQFEMNGGRINGVEALLRWHSAKLGAVSPSEFIPIAEENGAIAAIGDWVLRNAMEQGKRWIEAGHSDLLVSVNVSARQLKEHPIVSQLALLLLELRFPASNLCLEITETSAFDDMEQSLGLCREIADMGIKLALDDFGTGYSSIAMLSRFPFQTVKIDKSLIREMETNRKDVDILQAIVQLSVSSGLEVVAEGVETERQYALLRQLGCHTAQGYLLGRPMTGVDIGTLLENQK